MITKEFEMRKILTILFLGLSTPLFAAEPVNNSNITKTSKIPQPPQGGNIVAIKPSFINTMQACQAEAKNNTQIYQKCMSNTITANNNQISQSNLKKSNNVNSTELQKIENCRLQSKGNQKVFYQCINLSFPEYEEYKRKNTASWYEESPTTNQPKAVQNQQPQQTQTKPTTSTQNRRNNLMK